MLCLKHAVFSNITNEKKINHASWTELQMHCHRCTVSPLCRTVKFSDCMFQATPPTPNQGAPSEASAPSTSTPATEGMSLRQRFQRAVAQGPPQRRDPDRPLSSGEQVSGREVPLFVLSFLTRNLFLWFHCILLFRYISIVIWSCSHVKLRQGALATMNAKRKIVNRP